MKKYLLLSTSLLCGAVLHSPAAQAQHEQHRPANQPAKTDSLPKKKQVSPPMQHGNAHEGMTGMDHGEMRSMSHAFSLSLPMNRNGSGTGWLPDATPMYAYMTHRGPWMYMLHGAVYGRYTAQNITNPGKRGSESRISVPNWFMGMAQRPVGRNGLLLLRAMVSLDPITEGGAGYPLLFQTGETYEGRPIIDRQHQHDFISELAVGYTQRLSPKVDVSAYIGFPGEPALGPTAFMHRISAFSNPDATLGHHWQDATHILFGVATLGVRVGQFKLEGSSFTGREPDENRFGFDRPTFDSYSGRLSWAPSANWALQVSRGFLKEPEVLHPGEDYNRTTASAIHSQQFSGENRYWTSSLVWGMNQSTEGDHASENAFLLESHLQLNRIGVYGRYEFVQKSAEELFEDPESNGFDHDRIFPINALTGGVNVRVARFAKTLLVAGVQGTFFAADRGLDFTYGPNPISGQVYLRLSPDRMRRY
jgi:hypothetical protein